MELPIIPFRCRCLTEPGVEREFATTKDGQCPCGLQVADSRNRTAIFKLETIHFDAPTAFFGRGVGHAACDPKLKAPGGPELYFTGSAHGVTCPACKESQVYKIAKGLAGEPEVPTEGDSEWIAPVKPEAKPAA